MPKAISEKKKITDKRWRDANKERLYANSKAWKVANPERVRAQKKAWCSANPHKLRTQKLKSAYNLSRDTYDAMLSSQGFLCAICSNDLPKTPHVDHDHLTGTVRGVLCSACNLGLGHFKDDPKRLSTAIEYLNKSSGVRTCS